MFDFDAGKLLIVGVIALLFIPPKDLPRVLREVGQFVGRMRRMASDFQSQFMDAMREADMADVRKEARKLADSARDAVGFDSVHDLDRQMVAKRAPERLPEPRPDAPETPSIDPGAPQGEADDRHEGPQTLASTPPHSA